MTLAALLNQTVTLRSPSGETRDEIGGSSRTFTEATTQMYLEPGSGTGRGGGGEEQQPDRQTPIGDWFGVGLASVDWDSWQQVVYGDHVLDIVAPPRPFVRGLTGVEDHVELDLREVGWREG